MKYKCNACSVLWHPETAPDVCPFCGSEDIEEV